MPKTYRRSNDDIRALMNEVMKQYHIHLVNQSIIVDLIDAYNTSGGPAVTHNGIPAYAVIRCIPIKERAMGRGDVEITFDALVVGGMADDEKRALIDHELYHLETKRNKDGQVQLDDLGRAEYKLQPHDREFGWFDTIARRWGKHSVEAKQAVAMAKDETFRNLYLAQNDKLTSKTITNTQSDNSLDPA